MQMISLKKKWGVLIYPHLWSGLVLFVLAALVFIPMLDNGFAYMAADDNWMLYNNAQVYSLDWGNIVHYFTSFFHGQYSPVNTLAYSVIYSIFGMNPFWYHVFSLMLHIFNTLLVYNFIHTLLQFSVPKKGLTLSKNNSIRIAFFTALLFAIHPIQVESVAWISASKVVFYAFLFLECLVLYLKYIEKRKNKYYIIALILFIISFGIKEQTVILPLCCLLIDWYLKRNWEKGRLLIEKIPFFVVAIGLGIVEVIGQQSFFGYNLEYHYYPFFQRMFLACYAIPEYLFKLFLPLHLSYWYAFPMKPGEPLPVIFWFYPLVVLAILFFLYRSWKTGKRYILFGAGFFFVNVVLALHIIPMSRGVMMADRYMYLSSIGMFFIISVLLSGLFKQLKAGGASWYLYAISFILYIIYLGSYTYVYANHWS